MRAYTGGRILKGLVIVLLMTAWRADAADYTWTGAVSALWNTTDANWTGGAGAVWADAAANNAIFGVDGPKTVTADPVTLSNLTFTADGYTIGGGPLLMYGNANASAGVNAILSAPVTNVGIWQKTGAGTVALDPGPAASNVFSSLKAVGGTLRHTSGTTLVTLVGGAPESGPALWVSGGTLVMDGGTLRTTGDKWARVSEYGTLLVTNGYVDLRRNNELLNAHNTPGVTTVGGNGILEVRGLRISQNSSSSESSLVNINEGGTLRLDQFTLDASAPRKGTVFFNGGTVVARTDTSDFFGTGSPNWLSGIFAKILAGGAVFDTNGKTITIKHPLLSGVAKRATYTLAPPQGHLREEAGEKEVTAGKAGLVQPVASPYSIGLRPIEPVSMTLAANTQGVWWTNPGSHFTASLTAAKPPCARRPRLTAIA